MRTGRFTVNSFNWRAGTPAPLSYASPGMVIAALIFSLQAGCEQPRQSGASVRDQLTLGPSASVPSTQPAVAKTPPGRPIAMVNGAAIERKELIDLLLKSHGLGLLQQLILRELAVQEARRVGATVSEADVLAEYEATLQAEHLDGKDPEKLTPTRRDQMIEDWTRSRGVTREELRVAMERQAHLRRVVQDKIQIDDEALHKEFERAYGEKVEIRHLQLAAARFFPQVKARLDNGEKFEDLVRQFSQNLLSRDRGGLLPPFSANDDTVPAVFAKTAFALKEGEYSNPIESEGSYHVLKLERRIPAEKAGFDDVREKMRKRLVARLAARAMQDLSARLLSQAELRIEDSILRDLYKTQQGSGQIQGPVLVGQ